MDENGLLSEIFETRYFGTNKCRLPYIIHINEKLHWKELQCSILRVPQLFRVGLTGPTQTILLLNPYGLRWASNLINNPKCIIGCINLTLNISIIIEILHTSHCN